MTHCAPLHALAKSSTPLNRPPTATPFVDYKGLLMHWEVNTHLYFTVVLISIWKQLVEEVHGRCLLHLGEWKTLSTIKSHFMARHDGGCLCMDCIVLNVLVKTAGTPYECPYSR